MYGLLISNIQEAPVRHLQFPLLRMRAHIPALATVRVIYSMATGDQAEKRFPRTKTINFILFQTTYFVHLALTFGLGCCCGAVFE
jgi:hypothetical protein